MTATLQQAPVAQSAQPMTVRQMDALQLQRNELKDQLGQLLRRRNQLDEQFRAATGDAVKDLQARLREIDARSADIDRQLMGLSPPLVNDAPVTDAKLAEEVARQAAEQAQQAVAGFPTVPSPPPYSSPADRLELVASVGLVIVGAGAVIWLAVRRIFAKPAAHSLEGHARRLDQLQQSIDVIAVEMERMSESQRYVAKVLNEKFPALGGGAAEQVAAKSKDAAKI